MATEIQFSAFQLIINAAIADAKVCHDFLKSVDECFVYKKSRYVIESEDLGDGFFWFYFRYGSCLPYSPEVYNEESGKQEKNPRLPYHTEPNKQIFCIYDSEKFTFYTSNAKNKNFFIELVKNTLGAKVTLKRIINSIEDFTKAVHYITKVELVKIHNLITFDESIFKCADDVFGLGKPSDAKLEVNFQSTRITEKFVQFLRTTLKKRQAGEVSNFICIGKDDKNMESIFNLDTIQYKISLSCEQDQFGMFNEDEVKDLTVSRLRKERVRNT